MSPGGWSNQHITDVKWVGEQDGEVGQSSREIMVEWISGGGAAFVQGPHSRVRVGVVDASPPYLRTYANGEWDDNLLSLPTF
ncbi:DUF3892 domain-containing protein [Mycolicibacterium grossiae]|nr:DUF3892 domain-containing protein [Mycolicibacterium grossiae]